MYGIDTKPIIKIIKPNKTPPTRKIHAILGAIKIDKIKAPITIKGALIASLSIIINAFCVAIKSFDRLVSNFEGVNLSISLYENEFIFL